MSSQISSHEITQLNIEFDDLQMQAWVTLEAGAFATLQTIKRAVASAGIRFGFDIDGLRELMEPADHERCVILARGKERIDGADGHLEMCIDEVMPYTIRPDGSFDYHGAVSVQTVHEGSAVAKVIDATEGKLGMTVKGVLVHAHQGVSLDGQKFAGEGVSCNDAGALIAIQTGVFTKTRQGQMQVTPMLVIEGDLDLSVGNIDTDRPVLIRGDVKSGFKVKSAGDVTVEGVIEDSRISAGGNLIVNKGILPGKERVKAHGQICAKFVQERSLKCSELIVEKHIRHCQVAARELCLADSVIGGHVTVGRLMRARFIGTAHEEATQVYIGVDAYELNLCEKAASLVDEKVSTLTLAETELNKMTEEVKDLTHKAQALASRQAPKAIVGVAVSKAQVASEKRKQMQENVELLQQDLNDCKAVADKLDACQTGRSDAEVIVEKDIYVGVSLTFGKLASKQITSTMTDVAFHVHNGAVLVRL